MNKAEILKLIQKHVPCVDTIDARMRDSLDFHDVYIKSLQSLVEEAYTQGKDSVLNCRHWDVVPKSRPMEYGDCVQ